MSATDLTACLACGNSVLHPVLDLGVQPPANLLLETLDDRYPSYPLLLNRCGACGHGQLSVSVDPAELFRGYLYASGTSATLGRFFDWFAGHVAAALPVGARVLDIACNDGSLLRRMAARGLNAVGVEPDRGMVDEAFTVATPVVHGFWPDCQGHPFIAGGFDMIVAMNVLAHVPDPLAFLKAARQVLRPGGIVVVQVSQARMLDAGEFDAIYHEHLSYFTYRSMETLAERAGLEIWFFRGVGVHGGSLAYVLCRSGDNIVLSEDFLETGEFEQSFQTGWMDDTSPPMAFEYKQFAAKALDAIDGVRYIVMDASLRGQKIAFVGAAAKAVVVMHATVIAPDLVVDEAPLKIGRWIPGVDRKIEPLSALAVDAPLLAVLSAWNYKDELEAKVKAVRGGRPTEFLTYFPAMDRWRG